MNKGTRILMTSAKGGVGVGFVTVNTALALCRRGLKVLLVDAGPFCRSHDALLGCEESVVYDLGDVAANRIAAEKALFRPREEEELYLLPGVFDPKDLPDAEGLTAVLAYLAVNCDFDVILVDAPALPDTVAGAAQYDLCCVVSDGGAASLRAAEAAGTALQMAGGSVRLIVNRFSLLRPQESGQKKAISMVDETHLWLLGLVPTVGELYELPKGRPHHLLDGHRAWRKEPARIAFDNLAGRLLEEDIPLLSGIGAVRRRRKELLY
jgi:septum site-determining protein MinD